MDLDEQDDDALVRAVSSEPEAFAALYRRYERALLGYTVRRTRRADLAADLTAETFAGALEALRRDAGPTGAFAPWLFGIARNKIIDSHRRGTAEEGATSPYCGARRPRRIGRRPRPPRSPGCCPATDG